MPVVLTLALDPSLEDTSTATVSSKVSVLPQVCQSTPNDVYQPKLRRLRDLKMRKRSLFVLLKNA